MKTLKGHIHNYKLGQLLLVSDNVECDPFQSWAVGYVHRLLDSTIRIYNSDGILYREWTYALPITEEFGKQVKQLLEFRVAGAKRARKRYTSTGELAED